MTIQVSVFFLALTNIKSTQAFGKFVIELWT